MAYEEIEITIDRSGKVFLRTIGFKGDQCLEVAEQFLQIIGREESRRMTVEYYEETSVKKDLPNHLRHGNAS